MGGIMGRKARHKGRTQRRYCAQLASRLDTQTTRRVKRFAKVRLRYWTKHADTYEKRAFVSLVAPKPRASTKLAPQVYHLVRLVGDEWTTKHFATRSIKTPRIRGLHSPTSATPNISNGLTSHKRSVMIDGKKVLFYGFSDADLTSLSLVRGKDYWPDRGCIIGNLDSIGLQTVRTIASILATKQF